MKYVFISMSQIIMLFGLTLHSRGGYASVVWSMVCASGTLRPYSLFFYLLSEPVHETSNNVVCATSKASDQPAHTRSLIRAFASRLS